LVRAGGGLTSTADTVEFWDDVVDFLAGDQTADALQVAIASAHKEDLQDHAVVIDRHIDELRAGTLGFVEGVFHDKNKKNYYKSKTVIINQKYINCSLRDNTTIHHLGR